MEAPTRRAIGSPVSGLSVQKEDDEWEDETNSEAEAALLGSADQVKLGADDDVTDTPSKDIALGAAAVRVMLKVR